MAWPTGQTAPAQSELPTEDGFDHAGPQPSGRSRGAAFFDLDKTVIAKSSTLAFGREFYREGLLDRTVLLKAAYAQFAFQRSGANEERMERSRIALLELTRGWDANRVQRLVRETLQAVIDPLIYAEALELFEEHRRAGRDLYIVSSSGVEVVRPLAEYLGVPHVIATRARIDEDGRYDGTLEFYCYAENKATAIRDEARRRRLDLEDSYAYSDSITDVAMLEAVAHPVAVNPDRELRTVAEQRGWEIRDFRHPIRLRDRLGQVPRPPAEVLAGAGAVGALAAAGWLLYLRRRPSGIRTPRSPPAGNRAVRRRTPDQRKRSRRISTLAV